MSPDRFVKTLLSSLLVLSLLWGSAPLIRAAGESPVDLLQKGLEAMLEERFDDAIRAFETVLEYDRRNQAAQLGLKGARAKRLEAIDRQRAAERPALDAASKAVSRRDWPEAVDRLRGVLERQSDHPKALSLWRSIHQRMAKERDKAKPQSGDWYYAMGVLAYMEQDWLKAVDSWEQVVAFDPDQVGLISKIEQAKAGLKVKESTDRIRLLQTVAFEQLTKGDYDQAIDQWESLLALDPDNVQAKEGIIEARKARGEQSRRDRKEEIQKLTEQAMDAYIEKKTSRSASLWRQVLDLDPDNTLARDYLRRMSGQSGFESPSSSAPSGFDRAMAFLKDERYPEAIEYLERYVEKYPNDAKARKTLDDVLSKQKDLADTAYQDGLMTYSQGDIQGAIAHWQAALRINPDYQRARQAIIKAMAEQKKRLN